MKQIEVTDEWLCKYMPIVGEAIIRELEEGTDYGYRFSAKFERRMKLMLWKEEHPWIRAAYRQLKRTAVLSICVAAGLLILTMSAEGNRMKLFDPKSRIISTQNIRTLEPPVCQEIIGPAP